MKKKKVRVKSLYTAGQLRVQWERMLGLVAELDLELCETSIPVTACALLRQIRRMVKENLSDEDE